MSPGAQEQVNYRKLCGCTLQEFKTGTSNQYIDSGGHLPEQCNTHLNSETARVGSRVPRHAGLGEGACSGALQPIDSSQQAATVRILRHVGRHEALQLLHSRWSEQQLQRLQGDANLGPCATASQSSARVSVKPFGNQR